VLVKKSVSNVAEAVRRPWSIATILTISMVAIIAVLMIVLTVVELRRERNFSRNDQQERGQLLVGGLRDALADHIYFNDVDALRDISSRAVESRTDLDYFQLWDVDGSLLAASSKENSQTDYPTVLSADSFGFESAQRGVTSLKFQGNRLQVTGPIFAGPDVVGVFQFGFNSVALDAKLRSILIQHIWQALGLIAIGIVLSYLMARYASKPLREISASAAEIGQGNLDAPVPMRGARETADLGRSLANMRDDLKALYNDLETRVESRTSELARTSDRLRAEVGDRKAAEESLSQRNQELEILLNLASILGRAGDYKEKCQEVLEDIARITQADQVVLRVLEEDQQTLTLVAAAGEISPMRPLSMNKGDSLTASALRQKTPLVVNDYSASPQAVPELVAQGVRSGLFLPLVSGESQDLGVVNVLSKQPGHFNEETVRMLTAVADGLGVLLENARLFQDVAQLAQDLESIRDAVMLMDSQGNFRFVNKTFEETFGYTSEEVLGNPAGMLSPGVSRAQPDAREVMEETIQEGWRGVVKRVKKSGEELDVDLTVTPVRNQEGDAMGVIVVAQDITERKRAEEALREAEDRYRLIFENASDAIITFSLDNKIISMNPEAEKMTGYSQKELVGQLATVYLTPASAQLVEDAMRRWQAGERQPRTLECEGVRKDGVIVPFEGRTQFIRDEAGTPVGYQGIFRDITERKRAEAERRDLEIRALAQSKLATLGEVATGVAHEINQPLTYISSMIQAFQEDISLNDLDMQKGQARLAESSRQVARITSIVDHLRTFGRREDTEMTEVNLAEVLDSTMLLVGEKIRLRNIELERLVDDDLPPVWGNASQLEQVYINLFQNSIDALTETNSAKITVAIHSLPDKGRVVLAFSDNGVGIPPAYVEKVFDPFFTTKQEGEGTGLGLSIIYGIIMDHRGTIACESTYTKGTTITINLPRMAIKPGKGVPEQRIAKNNRVNRGKIA